MTYSLPQIYEEFSHTINNADQQKDLKWWSNNHGINMAMNWPSFVVSFLFLLKPSVAANGRTSYLLTGIYGGVPWHCQGQQIKRGTAGSTHHAHQPATCGRGCARKPVDYPVVNIRLSQLFSRNTPRQTAWRRTPAPWAVSAAERVWRAK